MLLFSRDLFPFDNPSNKICVFLHKNCNFCRKNINFANKMKQVKRF